jgi:hypothetical protein
MSIQQSVNQLLGTAGIAAGLYAHQPNVQKKRAEKVELQNIINRQKKLDAYEDQVTNFIESDEYGKITEGLTEEQAERLVNEKFGAEPTEEMQQLEKRRAELDPEYAEQLFERSKKNMAHVANQQKILKKKQEAVQAAAAEKQQIAETRNKVLSEPVQVTPREVIRYGK